MSKKTLKTVLSMCLILAIMASLSVCAFAEGTTTKDTLYLITTNDHGNVNPAESIGDNAAMLMSMCTNYLFDYYRNGDGVEYGICDKGLATEYTLDDDNMGITIKLREGVKFQNGNDFTAKDVPFSFGFFKDSSDMSFIDFANIQIVDDYTVYVPFTRLYSGALSKLGVIPMWSSEYFDEIGGDTAIFFHDAPIGTGAYQIVEYIRDDHVNLVANPNYYEGAPIISNINVRFITESSVAFSELETGGADYLYKMSGTDITALQSGLYDGQLELYSQMQSDAFNLGFNGYSPLWKDVRVRQAFCYAVDRSSCVMVFDGLAVDMWWVLADDSGRMNKYEGDDWFYPYNPDMAKQLLAEAGYVDNDGDGIVESPEGQPLVVRWLYLGTNQTYATIGEVLKNNLQQVGIGMELKPYDRASYDSAMRNDVNDWDMMAMNMEGPTTAKGWDITPNIYLQTYIHADQFDTWADYQEKWIEPLNGELDTTKFWEMFSDYQDVVLTSDYLYYYPLLNRIDASAYVTNLHGLDRISAHTWYVSEAYFD